MTIYLFRIIQYTNILYGIIWVILHTKFSVFISGNFCGGINFIGFF